ncbi:MAG: hypothetical protein J3Q66DRAFT_158083 [Benniella sp.]|nr:MAG: hypothetical protein J3Q66DRAFT_158083 [Benniella sp.]
MCSCARTCYCANVLSWLYLVGGGASLRALECSSGSDSKATWRVSAVRVVIVTRIHLGPHRVLAMARDRVVHAIAQAGRTHHPARILCSQEIFVFDSFKSSNRHW